MSFLRLPMVLGGIFRCPKMLGRWDHSTASLTPPGPRALGAGHLDLYSLGGRIGLRRETNGSLVEHFESG